MGDLAKELETIGKLLFDKAGTLEQEKELIDRTPDLISLYEEVASEAQKRVL